MISPSTQSVRRLAASPIAALLLLPAAADASPESPRVLFHPAREDYALGITGKFDFGDLNGDGILDMVAPHDDAVAVFLGRADGTFADPVDFGSFIALREVVLRDLDGNGTLDAAAASWSGLAILLGDGHGGLGSAVEYDAGPREEALAVADFDGDGDPDVAITFEHGIAIYLNNGDATFTEPFSYPAGVFPRDVEAADLNLDEIPDLVVAAVEYHETEIYVFLGVGDGTFLTGMAYAAGDHPRSIDIGDLNGDPFPDVAVANSWYSDSLTWKLSVLFGMEGGALSPPLTITLADLPRRVAIGDLNEDGAQDLAGLCERWIDGAIKGVIWLVPGDGTGGFGEPRWLPTASIPDAVRFLDRNDDGHTDLVAANGYLSTFPGNGTLDTAIQRYPTLGRGGVDMVCDRFDGDGIPDLVVLTAGGPEFTDVPTRSAISAASPNGTSKICFLRGLGDGSFAEPVRSGYVSAPSAFARGDFDGNGTLDLVVVEDGPDQAGVWLGDGNGAFLRHAGYDAGQNPRQVAVGHLDEDDLLDIVVTNQSGVGVLFGTGGGNFEPAQFMSVGDAQRLVLADVDDDGALDIVVLIRVGYNGRVDALYGAGDGTFPHTRTLPLPATTRAPLNVDVVDLDADGHTDVVAVLAQQYRGLYVLWRTADGDYRGESYPDYWIGGQSMAFGDVSGDGRLDVLAMASHGGCVKVFLGEAAQQPAVALRLQDLEYGVGHYAEAIVLEDLDGDGDLDAATANRGTRDVSVLLGTAAPHLGADAALLSVPASREELGPPAGAAALALGRPFPSPFRTETSVSFVLPADAHVRMSVFDVSGRLVRALVQELRPAGRYTITWDGRNDERSSVPAGVYFVRLDAGRVRTTAKVLRLP